MAVNSTPARPATKRSFIGRAWINEAKGGANKGTKFISVVFDRGVSGTIDLANGSNLMLWPNNKREGKRDADYRVSVLEPVPTK